MKSMEVFPGTTHSGLDCHMILNPGSGSGQTAHISPLACLMLKTSVIRMIKTEFVSISKVGQLYLKAVKKLTSAFVRREMNSRDTLMTKSWNSSLDQSGM
ncbi:hypothetical protein Y1Q_0010540 [Alligator mississippiensis]|uniref:Uncharacterized protein n=1 Tax=Alligator mississippiensis TaxID=8496 RepID=A0A151NDC7_ALLMI|nr:hypothetical protein Y1Q_0010540 [Alligator mississippiensis]